MISALVRRMAASGPSPNLSVDAAALFLRYDWPRKVRELEKSLSQAAVIAKAVKRTHRALREADAQPPGPERDEHLHEMRKAAKRLRYATEALRPVRKATCRPGG